MKEIKYIQFCEWRVFVFCWAFREHKSHGNGICAWEVHCRSIELNSCRFNRDIGLIVLCSITLLCCFFLFCHRWRWVWYTQCCFSPVSGHTHTDLSNWPAWAHTHTHLQWVIVWEKREEGIELNSLRFNIILKHILAICFHKLFEQNRRLLVPLKWW